MIRLSCFLLCKFNLPEICHLIPKVFVHSKQQGAAMKFIDIGANLTDGMYQGSYHGKQKHEADLTDVLSRSFDNGMEKMMITGGCLSDCQESVKLANTDARLYTTIGCHPTRCGEFEGTADEPQDPEKYYNQLLQLITDNKDKVVAVGECGLDYDRLHFCNKETQLKYFERQFDLAEQTGLPMFLHSRAAHEDMIDLLKKHRDRFKGGVVHSFTGSMKEAKEYTDLGLFIGINGCSLKTEENVEAMKSIPTEWLMIETALPAGIRKIDFDLYMKDAPWCEVKRTHAGYKHVKTTFPEKKADKWEKGTMVKSRNEPARIIQVMEVMAGARGEEAGALAEAMYQNTCKIFSL